MILQKSDGTMVASVVELADTFVKQSIGLMFRKQIPEKYAMIFDMGRERRDLGFHMLFVRFPIDLLYLDKGRQVVGVRHLRPWRGLAFPGRPARYVIELPAGTCERLAIREGDVFDW